MTSEKSYICCSNVDYQTATDFGEVAYFLSISTYDFSEVSKSPIGGISNKGGISPKSCLVPSGCCAPGAKGFGGCGLGPLVLMVSDSCRVEGHFPYFNALIPNT